MERLREKLNARKEGDIKAILKLPPRMNWRMKKNNRDRMVTIRP
jgi:hypothetical protein